MVSSDFKPLHLQVKHQLLTQLVIYDDQSFFSEQRARGRRCQSIPAILPHLQQLSV